MTSVDPALLRDRARGCLLGQFIGDSLGSLVEFETPEEIAERYPDGVRDLADGGTWNLIAGQPTDDSQMAMMLIRSLQRCGTFDANAVFVTGLVTGIRGGAAGEVVDAMEAAALERAVAQAIAAGRTGVVSAYEGHMGWVLLALSIAVRQLVLYDDPVEALVDAVGMGGDTDTNAAIAGALLGAVHGAVAWPERWVTGVLECEPAEGRPGVANPLGREFWATGLLEQADELAGTDYGE